MNRIIFNATQQTTLQVKIVLFLVSVLFLILTSSGGLAYAYDGTLFLRDGQVLNGQISSGAYGQTIKWSKEPWSSQVPDGKISEGSWSVSYSQLLKLEFIQDKQDDIFTQACVFFKTGEVDTLYILPNAFNIYTGKGQRMVSARDIKVLVFTNEKPKQCPTCKRNFYKNFPKEDFIFCPYDGTKLR